MYFIIVIIIFYLLYCVNIEPGIPRSLTAIPWTTLCLDLSWIEPQDDGGIVQQYKVHGKKISNNIKKTYNSNNEYKI